MLIFCVLNRIPFLEKLVQSYESLSKFLCKLLNLIMTSFCFGKWHKDLHKKQVNVVFCLNWFSFAAFILPEQSPGSLVTETLSQSIAMFRYVLIF